LGPSQLAWALQQLAQHREPLSPDLAQHLLQPFVRRLKSGSSSEGAQPQAASMDWSCLTGREREVARLVAEGYTDREIAQQLSISEHTVKNHVKKCLAKTRSKNRAQLAALVAGLPTAMGAAKSVMHHRR
ncbi:MAG TPA: LuxR C-terminal-related transcriptional regulator, partial [Bacillota bacterium]